MDTVIELAKAWLKMCDDVDAGRAYSCDIIRELLAVVERASRDPSLPGWMDTVASGTPCCECGCECIEFSRPSEEWNATMRPDGHETDREYLCAPCYMNHLASRAERAESALAASESKRATLAEECRAWRRWKGEYHAAALQWSSPELTDARTATDAACALEACRSKA